MSNSLPGKFKVRYLDVIERVVTNSRIEVYVQSGFLLLGGSWSFVGDPRFNAGNCKIIRNSRLNACYESDFHISFLQFRNRLSGSVVD